MARGFFFKLLAKFLTPHGISPGHARCCAGGARWRDRFRLPEFAGQGCESRASFSSIRCYSGNPLSGLPFLKAVTMKRVLLLALLLFAAPAASFAQVPGDWVLGRWQGGPYWFPGVIQSVTDTTINISYDDGTVETLPRALVRRYDWRAGTRVECRWNGGDDWYPGRITYAAEDGVTLSIAYDDGDRETTRTGLCRSR
jgi:hypothetical protein